MGDNADRIIQDNLDYAAMQGQEHENVRLAREQYARQDWRQLLDTLVNRDSKSYTDLDRLKLSALKWFAVASGGVSAEAAKAARTCSCCQKYLRAPDGDCKGCPIRAHTGRQYCYNTPYVTYCAKPTLANAFKEAKFLAILVKQYCHLTYYAKPTLANAFKEAKFLAKLVKQHESDQS